MLIKLAVLVALPLAIHAQVATDANAAYRTPEGRASLAAALDSHERDARLRPEELVAKLGIRPGDTVVDLGTGPGHMLPYLSRAVGPRGKVIAEDIQADFVDEARAKAQHDGLRNVTFVLGADADPKLPENAVNLVFALDVYHHFDYPEKMLAAIRKSLAPNGRLALVEYYRRPGAIGGSDPNFPLRHIRLDADAVIKEVEANGFRLLSRGDHIPGSQYIAIFAKTP